MCHNTTVLVSYCILSESPFCIPVSRMQYSRAIMYPLCKQLYPFSMYPCFSVSYDHIYMICILVSPMICIPISPMICIHVSPIICIPISPMICIPISPMICIPVSLYSCIPVSPELVSQLSPVSLHQDYELHLGRNSLISGTSRESRIRSQKFRFCRFYTKIR